MSTQVLDTSTSKTSSSSINQFIRNTQLSDEGSVTTLASSGHKSDMFHSDNAGDSPDLAAEGDNNDSRLNTINEETKSFQVDDGNLSDAKESQNKYQGNLKYLPNRDFHYSQNESFPITASPPHSIPNTFKYKSHPNAKTKVQLGDQVREQSQDQSQDHHQHHHHHHQQSPPIKTSTINLESNTTPDWMPSELNDKWPLPELNPDADAEFRLSVKITKNPSLNFNSLNSNSIVHNSKPESHTPLWKRMANEYEANKNDQPQLKNIFLSSDSLRNNKSVNHNTNNEALSNSISSTISTPYATMNKNHLTKHQITELENLLQQDHDKPDDFPIQIPNQVSPLKLFGKYNTFTKGKLNDILQRMNNKSVVPSPELEHRDVFAHDSIDGISNDQEFVIRNNNISNHQSRDAQNLPEPEPETETDQETETDPEPEQEPSQNLMNITKRDPKLKFKPFDKDDLYSQEKFMKKANNIFDNIQKRGFPAQQSSSTNLTSRNRSISIANTNHTTATSTPKAGKVGSIDELPNEPLKSFDNYTYNDNNNDNDNDNDNDADAYSSFTSGFDNNENTRLNSDIGRENTNQQDIDEYTSLSSSSFNSNTEANIVDKESQPKDTKANNRQPQLSPRNLKTLQEQLSNDNNSSYTFEDVTNVTSKTSHKQSHNDNVELQNKIKQLEAKVNSFDIYRNNMESLIDENNHLRLALEEHTKSTAQVQVPDTSQISIDEYDLTHENSRQFQDFIRWKRASQLKLQQEQKLPKKQSAQASGKVHPDIQLPNKYNNMIFDDVNYRWIMNDDKENERHGSLDSIEDLVSESEEKTVGNENSILKVNNGNTTNRQKSNNKLEVSFHIPHSHENDTKIRSSPGNGIDDDNINNNNDDNENDNDNDVTRLSQIDDDFSYSQTQRKLVAIITDNLLDNINHTNWKKVQSISLVEEGLNNINELDEFLPNLLKLDLSNNYIKFLQGIPTTIFDLNLSGNKIENLTSFKDFYDLQYLNLSNNYLTNLNVLNNNIHLTSLNLNGNEIHNLKGIEKMINLVNLDLSSNKLHGKLDFNKSKLTNLQELNVSDNKITQLVNLQELPSLRVLTVNDNHLVHLECGIKHQHLKKLSVKFNKLEQLDLLNFPLLRVLRFDGNRLNKLLNLRKLKYLEEVSAKSQINEIIIEETSTVKDIKTLDLSGNNYLKSEKFLTWQPLVNINSLTLSAINIQMLPKNFGSIFPNVHELNLNFNKLTNIDSLQGLTNLRKVYLVSNNLSKVEHVLISLKGSRTSLKSLDLRLNSLNLDFYPFLFNPQELEIGGPFNADITSPIQLESLDDIESFAIHYQSLIKSNSDWQQRDAKFFDNLKSHKLQNRLNYETLLINYFPKLKVLDGSVITSEKRLQYQQRLKLSE